MVLYFRFDLNWLIWNFLIITIWEIVLDDRRLQLQPPTLQTTIDQTPYWSDVIPNIDNQSAPAHVNSGQWASAYHTRDSIGPNTNEQINIVTNPDGSTSATITVPNNVKKISMKWLIFTIVFYKVAGAIIGKGGNRIRSVRQNSGADISIDSAVGPGNERIITIKGTQQQIHFAHQMLRKRFVFDDRFMISN